MTAPGVALDPQRPLGGGHHRHPDLQIGDLGFRAEGRYRLWAIELGSEYKSEANRRLDVKSQEKEHIVIALIKSLCLERGGSC